MKSITIHLSDRQAEIVDYLAHLRDSTTEEYIIEAIRSFGECDLEQPAGWWLGLEARPSSDDWMELTADPEVKL